MMKSLVDWFDVRLGVREFYEKHIAYPLPEEINVWNLLGGLTIGCILIQFATGIYMICYYIPNPELAHESIKAMCNKTAYGELIRNLHRWSATMGVMFLIMHAIHGMARRAYLPPRELNWWTGLALGVTFVLLLISGIIMPWDWRSYWELVIWMDWINTIPLVGQYLKGPLLSWFSMGKNLAMHAFILPAIIAGLVMIHIIVFRRLGLSKRV